MITIVQSFNNNLLCNSLWNKRETKDNLRTFFPFINIRETFEDLLCRMIPPPSVTKQLSLIPSNRTETWTLCSLMRGTGLQDFAQGYKKEEHSGLTRKAKKQLFILGMTEKGTLLYYYISISMIVLILLKHNKYIICDELMRCTFDKFSFCYFSQWAWLAVSDTVWWKCDSSKLCNISFDCLYANWDL